MNIHKFTSSNICLRCSLRAHYCISNESLILEPVWCQQPQIPPLYNISLKNLILCHIRLPPVAAEAQNFWGGQGRKNGVKGAFPLISFGPFVLCLWTILLLFLICSFLFFPFLYCFSSSSEFKGGGHSPQWKFWGEPPSPCFCRLWLSLMTTRIMLGLQHWHQWHEQQGFLNEYI